MFHLLVNSGGWSKYNNMAFVNERLRVLEASYTRPELIKYFMRDGNRLNETLILQQHPIVVLASETGDGSQQAEICRFTRVEDHGAWVEFDCERMAGMPLIPNFKLEKLSTALDFGPYDKNYGELSRGHWAIKNVDLFKCFFVNTTVTRSRSFSRSQIRSSQSLLPS